MTMKLYIMYRGKNPKFGDLNNAEQEGGGQLILMSSLIKIIHSAVLLLLFS